jgi:hypothetical protein
VRIDVGELRVLLARLKSLNSVSLDQIEWVENDVLIEVDKKDIDGWKYIGLSNQYFFTDFLEPELLKRAKQIKS